MPFENKFRRKCSLTTSGLAISFVGTALFPIPSRSAKVSYVLQLEATTQW